MSSQDRPETTAAAASAPAREPKAQPAGQPQGDAARREPATDSVSGASAPSRGGPRHARRRHRSGGGSDLRGGEGRELQPRQLERELNLDELRELSELIIEQGFTEFEIEREGFRLRISRQSTAVPPAHTGPPPFVPPPVTPVAPPAATASAPSAPAPPPGPLEPVASAVNTDEALHKITSPIVGTFYRSPSPTTESFVRAGSHVEPDTVVCIIEAMKLMNEIQAEVSGTVEKIYVENGQPVEYGQALFGIKK